LSNRKRVAIIGGGISGLAVLNYLKSGDNAIHVDLFEKSNRLGGTIGTDRIDGYTCDWGPNGFLDREPATLELVDDLGLSDKLVRAKPRAEKRFVFRSGRLHPVSPHPVKFLTSPLLSIKGRLRVLLEPFVGKKTDSEDETVFDFAARRIGSEAAEILVDPMVSGIFGGDARRSSLRACFPRMVQMEEEYGSLVKALIAKKKQGSSGGPSGPTGRLTSFENGLYTLIERFHEKYDEHISFETNVETIRQRADGYSVITETGSFDQYNAVILATPSYTAADILKSISSRLHDLLNSIPYAPMAVCCFGYTRDRVKRDLDGFGFLVPHIERRDILGSIWTSSIFPDQAPPESHLLRTMLGGFGNDSIAEMSEDDLVEIASRELQSILGLPPAPGFIRVFKWKRAIPQYMIGHTDKMRDIESILHRNHGIYLVGNAYTGVGLNDCVLGSRRVAESIILS